MRHRYPWTPCRIDTNHLAKVASDAYRDREKVVASLNMDCLRVSPTDNRLYCSPAEVHNIRIG